MRAAGWDNGHGAAHFQLVSASRRWRRRASLSRGLCSRSALACDLAADKAAVSRGGRALRRWWQIGNVPNEVALAAPKCRRSSLIGDMVEESRHGGRRRRRHATWPTSVDGAADARVCEVAFDSERRREHTRRELLCKRGHCRMDCTIGRRGFVDDTTRHRRGHALTQRRPSWSETAWR